MADTPEKPTRIRRAKHNAENRYFLASRQTAQDKALTYKAAGLLFYLLSKPDDWQVQPKDLERDGSKKNAVYAILQELREKRYIQREWIREDGKVTGIEYIIHEEPFPENQDTAFQDTENREHSNTEGTTESTESTETTSAPPADAGTRGESSDNSSHSQDVVVPSGDNGGAAVKRGTAVWFDYPELIKAVGEVFGQFDKAANCYVTLLRGTAKSGEWAKFKLDIPADADELRRFKVWYYQEHGSDALMVTRPMKINSEIAKFRASETAPTTATGSADNRPLPADAFPSFRSDLSNSKGDA